MRTATFYAIGSFLVRSRNLFVIVGDVVEGEVSAGMKIALPIHDDFSVEAEVRSVELVDVLHEGKSYLGLALEYEHPDELEIMRALEISGVNLQLETKDREGPG